MMQSDQTDSNGKRIVVGVTFSAATVKRLDELAREAGMSRASLAASLVDEILPSVTGVRRRLQIVRKEPGR